MFVIRYDLEQLHALPPGGTERRNHDQHPRCRGRSLARAIRSDVPIVVEGNAPAVRDMGGTLLQQLQTVEVESLPMNVPTSFQVDVSGLDDFEKGLYVRDLEVGADVTILTDPDDLIARVSQPRVEAVEEEVEAEEGEVPEDADAEAPVAEGEAGA